MTSILKSESTKNGIILKEVAKKFEEATSTSGCDLEMSEITSSMPNSLSLNIIDNCTTNMATEAQITLINDVIDEDVKYVKITDEVLSDIEDVIDGFSVFSFMTEDDLIKFSIKNEKIDALSESENSKCKKLSKSKKQMKYNKVTKELSCTEDGIDIYDFQGNSESSPSSKNSSVNFKKTLNKKFSTKYIKKFKHKFKTENNLSPSEENSSSTSVTESHANLLTVDGRNESPRPTSNDDNNVVSTTTPDNGNFKVEKSDLMSAVDKLPSTSLRSPLKSAALRLYKLEDELASSSQSILAENTSGDVVEQQITTFYSPIIESVKVYNIQSQIGSDDEKYQPKIVPTKFSVDLLTKISDDSNKCLSNPVTNYDWSNIVEKSPSLDSTNSVPPSSINSNKHTVFETATVTCSSYPQRTDTTSKMTSTIANPIVVNSNGCSSGASYKDGSVNSNGSCVEVRTNLSGDNLPVSSDHDSNNEKNVGKSTTNSPMQSWLELHTKGLLYQQHNTTSHSNIQSNTGNIPTKPISISSFNPLSSSFHSNNSHSNSNSNNKTPHDSSILDWKNNYYDSTKLLANAVPKFNQNFNSLSHELASNIRYQQEQQELMNALRSKHENSKIPKPLVHMGLDSMYKLDHSSYKNPESRFQTPSVHNYFMPNSQLPTEFNTANVFKTRSDPRCHQSSVDATSNKDSFGKSMSSLSSSNNFKTPETVKRRGQWCDMHVKIAYFIYRSQRRMNMLKSQELNSQLSHLMYSQKLPPNGTLPTASPYPSSYLQHSSPYLDYRSSAQLKPEPAYLNYPSKSSNAFLNSPIRPINPYHSLLPQNLDHDLLAPSIGNNYEEHHQQQQSPEQKWLRLLSHFMTNHPLSSVDRPNPEILNQLYIWYQQLAQNTNSTSNPMPHFNAQPQPTQPPSSAIDQNAIYLRKYMEHISGLSSMKTESSNGGSGSAGYMNNSMSEREMQLYVLKQQQQYQKALFSKYQSAAINKPPAMSHMNPLLLNSQNPFYNKKLMEMKSLNSESMLPQYPVDCVQSLVNSQKYRLSQDQLRQIKQQDSLSNHHHSRNGFSKQQDLLNPKRRKLNSESLKPEMMSNEKEESKSIIDITTDYVSNNNNNNVNLENKAPSKSRENINFHLQTMIPPSDSKE